MAGRARLDNELVRRGLAPSRASAQRAIQDGRVMVGGMPAERSATLVSPDTPIRLADPEAKFVSRGGDKLNAALDRLDLRVADRRWLDAGASTGGFTDCLLQRGAAQVVAVDVGYGQFDWSLRNDERVHLLERTNVRTLDPGVLPWAPDGVVADLSFISLAIVLPALAGVAPGSDADFVVLVKPQFEAGKEAVGRGGVVRDPSTWSAALAGVARAAEAQELGVVAAVPSAFPGPAGNREFFLHLRRGATSDPELIGRAIQEVS